MPARIELKYIKKDGEEDSVKMDVRPEHQIEDLLSTAIDFWEDGEDVGDFVFVKDGDPIETSSTVKEEGIGKDDTLELKSKDELSSTQSRTDSKIEGQYRADRSTTKTYTDHGQLSQKRERTREPTTDLQQDQHRPSIEGDDDVKLWIEEEVGVSRTSLEITTKEKLEEDKNRFELTDGDGHRFEVVTEGKRVIHYRPILQS